MTDDDRERNPPCETQSEGFAFHAYAGWQPEGVAPKTLRACHYLESWEPDCGPGEALIIRRVCGWNGEHAIERFRVWQQEGYGDTWLLNQPVGQKCEEYTVVSLCQFREIQP